MFWFPIRYYSCQILTCKNTLILEIHKQRDEILLVRDPPIPINHPAPILR